MIFNFLSNLSHSMTSLSSNSLEVSVWNRWSYLKYYFQFTVMNQYLQYLLSPDQRTSLAAEPSFLRVCTSRGPRYTISPRLHPLYIFHSVITSQNTVNLIKHMGFILPNRSFKQLLKMSQRVFINLPFPHTLNFKVFKQQPKTIKGNS